MSPAEVDEGVRAILSARNPDVELRPDLPLGAAGLALDSIALVEILLECEERFGLSIAAETLGGSPSTVGALTERIRSLAAR